MGGTGLEPVTPACRAGVSSEAVQDNGFVLDFGDHTIVSGTLKLRLTNVATLQAIEVNSTSRDVARVASDVSVSYPALCC
jgi:hypothetical protein